MLGGDGVYERIEYDYNRQGQVIEMKDPNETVHQYQFDGLGRTTEDAITAFGTGIDQAVKRIEITYDSRRQLRTKVSQYDAATGGSVVNEVEFAYNDFRQLSDDKQEHDGAVDGNTLKVSYGYEDGDEANTIRRTSMIYPNGRVLDYQYGTADGANDSLSRVESLQINGETPKLCTYTYVGAARYVKIAYPEPDIELSYFKESGAPDGDAGDKYAGYDRFGRTVDMRWIASTGGAVKDRIQYGYDRASNRTWRKNLAATDGGQDYSYRYDGLYQVKQAAKGTLNLNQTAIAAIPAEDEAFGYDPTGNWNRYRREEDGTEELDQSRVNNQDNQITQIDGSSDGIAHDRAGNATKMPPDASGDWSKYYQLTWDGWNRLVEVKDENGGAIATYEYDGLYRRTTKTASDETRHFYYNEQWKSVEERVDSGSSSSSLSSSSGAEEADRQYLWGVRPGHRDELIRRDRSDTGTLDEKLYSLMDYFNPTLVVNTSGAVQERYAFSAFGLRAIMDADWIDRAASSFDFDFAFHGQFIDDETEHYDYGFRYYSPQLGQWLSRDPIEEKGGINLYARTGNTALNRGDFLGLSETEHQCPCGSEIDDVFDDAGRCCKKKKLRIVEWRIRRARGKDDKTGHAYICIPDERIPFLPQTDKRYGFYSARQGGSESELIPYQATAWDFYDDDVVDGVVKKNDRKYHKYYRYKVCPETLKILEDSIKEHENDPYGLSNVRARNCMGWVIERLQDAGLPTPWANPAHPQLTPNSLTDEEQRTEAKRIRSRPFSFP